MAKKTVAEQVVDRAAPTEAELTTEEAQITAHPDIVLLDQVANAKLVIERLDARIAEVVAAERAKSAQYTPEQVLAAKTKFNTWLGKYSGIIRTAIRQGVDLDGFEANPATDEIDVHPIMLQMAKHKIAGLVNSSSVVDLNKRMYEYIVEARDEDGAHILNDFDQQELKKLYLPPAAPVVKIGAKQDKADKPKTERGGNEIQVKTTYPGTSVEIKINNNTKTGKFFIRGAGLGTVIDNLAAAGVNISKDQMKAWVSEVGPSLV